MKYLWAPWRLQYIQNTNAEKGEGCIFCTIPKDPPANDQRNLLLFRGEKAFVMLNKFPYNNGHLLIIPYRHLADFENLDGEEKLEMMDLIEKSVRALKAAFHPQGFNVGMNLGRVAGAGIDDHLHFHVVPRWNGDTNFMPVLGQTKVISSSLEDTLLALKTYFEK
ncbi:MAG: HIT domain-containing protein [Calditrichaeota bacterium]|nr:HIT domain-containing protein [Calditrichota bacterium]